MTLIEKIQLARWLLGRHVIATPVGSYLERPYEFMVHEYHTSGNQTAFIHIWWRRNDTRPWQHSEVNIDSYTYEEVTGA